MNDPITTDACLIRDAFDLKVKEVINRIIDMRDDSPFKELLASENISTRQSTKSAELGRLGAYQLVIMTLKMKLLDDYSLSDEKYDL